MERAMSPGDDDLDETELDAAMNEFEQHSNVIYEFVQEYIDEHELLEEMMSVLLLNMSVRLRMVGYALDTEQPSATGLKLDLDRFRREMDEGVRAAKKDADRFIAEVKSARSEAENEADEEPDDKGDGKS
jgi:hypothetical protein